MHAGSTDGVSYSSLSQSQAPSYLPPSPYSARLQQVTNACTVRYRDEMTEGSQLKSIAQRITDAVVKFDLLSTDPNSKVRGERS